MDHLRPGTALPGSLRLVDRIRFVRRLQFVRILRLFLLLFGILHDVAKSEKGRRVGVAFGIALTQRLVAGVQDGALSTPFFIVLQGTAGAFGAAITGGFHTLTAVLNAGAILSVSGRQPLSTWARMKSTPRRILFHKNTGS